MDARPLNAHWKISCFFLRCEEENRLFLPHDLIPPKVFLSHGQCVCPLVCNILCLQKWLAPDRGEVAAKEHDHSFLQQWFLNDVRYRFSHRFQYVPSCRNTTGFLSSQPISGLRFCSLFFVLEGAAIIVASTIVPFLMNSPFEASNSFTTVKKRSCSRFSSSRCRKLSIVV